MKHTYNITRTVKKINPNRPAEVKKAEPVKVMIPEPIKKITVEDVRPNENRQAPIVRIVEKVVDKTVTGAVTKDDVSSMIDASNEKFIKIINDMVEKMNNLMKEVKDVTAQENIKKIISSCGVVTKEDDFETEYKNFIEEQKRLQMKKTIDELVERLDRLEKGDSDGTSESTEDIEEADRQDMDTCSEDIEAEAFATEE